VRNAVIAGGRPIADRTSTSARAAPEPRQ
jgi:hypothetical protein